MCLRRLASKRQDYTAVLHSLPECCRGRGATQSHGFSVSGEVVLAVFETRLRFGVLAAASAPKRSALAPKRLASLRSIPLRRKCFFLRVFSVSEGAAGPPLRNGVREHGFAPNRSALLIQDSGRKARKDTIFTDEAHFRALF